MKRGKGEKKGKIQLGGGVIISFGVLKCACACKSVYGCMRMGVRTIAHVPVCMCILSLGSSVFMTHVINYFLSPIAHVPVCMCILGLGSSVFMTHVINYFLSPDEG